jgi:hypothetical protein
MHNARLRGIPDEEIRDALRSPFRGFSFRSLHAVSLAFSIRSAAESSSSRCSSQCSSNGRWGRQSVISFLRRDKPRIDGPARLTVQLHDCFGDRNRRWVEREISRKVDMIVIVAATNRAGTHALLGAERDIGAGIECDQVPAGTAQNPPVGRLFTIAISFLAPSISSWWNALERKGLPRYVFHHSTSIALGIRQDARRVM